MKPLLVRSRQRAIQIARGVLLSRVLHLEMARMAYVLAMKSGFYNNTRSIEQQHWQDGILVNSFIYRKGEVN
ncbi:hypothetical protein ccbrp13_36370 [Ktedonobacteria bacterium brp13]|nr:hypothetical protein ccbrp13_36370 [Ktedonobacteria bacterium brp13]